MKWLKYILLSLCLQTVPCQLPAQPTWEHISAYKPIDDSEDAEKIDVTVRDGFIYITTPRALNVKVLSIVGQLISQQNIPAGTSRFKVNARGIYILKVGDFTTRVTV